MGIFSSNKSSDDKKKGTASSNAEQPKSDKPKTKRELIAEKYSKQEARRLEIQEQLKWLENFNRNHNLNRD